MSEAFQTRSYVSHLECSLTGETYAHDRMHGLSPAGRPLLVRYDLEALRRDVSRDDIARRLTDLWMWRELLPLFPNTAPIVLGECMTPLVPLRGYPNVLIKDEGRLPTGSFKARGMAVAISMAKHFGFTSLVVPTAGNAGSAAAAYGAAAGMKVLVFTPRDTPDITVREIALHGATVYKIDGLIDLCGKYARAAVASQGGHDLSTLVEPYRLEGKKTIGLELALQMGWKLPDVIYYPTGGGTGFIGMWKAFEELIALGWLQGKLPRMISVQTEGCDPIRRAFDSGAPEVQSAFSPVKTDVLGVRVPKPIGDRLILDTIRRSGGHAASMSDDQAFEWKDRIARETGVSLCVEGSLCLAAYQHDLQNRRVSAEETAVVFNTATALKWPMPAVEGEGEPFQFEPVL